MSGDGAVEHHISVTKTARYWTLGHKDAPEVWFVLHGYKQLARRFLRRFTPIDEPGRLIVAPEALSRFYISAEPGRHGPASVVGATWMTREDRLVEIEDYVDYLDTLADSYRADERSVTVLGFSQGVATATRWVVHGRVRPTRLLLWGDYTPPDLALGLAGAALEGVDVALVRGDDDPGIDETLAAQEAERLRGAGIAYRTINYGGGHDIDAETLRSLVGG
jgi:predicted esterase